MRKHQRVMKEAVCELKTRMRIDGKIPGTLDTETGEELTWSGEALKYLNKLEDFVTLLEDMDTTRRKNGLRGLTGIIQIAEVYEKHSTKYIWKLMSIEEVTEIVRKCSTFGTSPEAEIHLKSIVDILCEYLEELLKDEDTHDFKKTLMTLVLLQPEVHAYMLTLQKYGKKIESKKDGFLNYEFPTEGGTMEPTMLLVRSLLPLRLIQKHYQEKLGVPPPCQLNARIADLDEWVYETQAGLIISDLYKEHRKAQGLHRSAKFLLSIPDRFYDNYDSYTAYLGPRWPLDRLENTLKQVKKQEVTNDDDLLFQKFLFEAAVKRKRKMK